jgi:hypothetical protein
MPRLEPGLRAVSAQARCRIAIGTATGTRSAEFDNLRALTSVAGTRSRPLRVGALALAADSELAWYSLTVTQIPCAGYPGRLSAACGRTQINLLVPHLAPGRTATGTNAGPAPRSVTTRG